MASINGVIINTLIPPMPCGELSCLGCNGDSIYVKIAQRWSNIIKCISAVKTVKFKYLSHCEFFRDFKYVMPNADGTIMIL